jgi:hypothetical protein
MPRPSITQRLSRAARLAPLPLLLLAGSCAAPVPLDNRPCPCAAGWVCCSAGVCAKDLATCPGGEMPGSNDAGMSDTSTDTQVMPEPAHENPHAPTYPADPAVTVPAGLTGSWTGYFENFKFPSGSDSVKLTLAQGELTMIVGAEPPPAPATDPAAVWPPGTSTDLKNGAGLKPASMEGFRYTAHDVRWAGQRLTFKAAGNEAFQSWCALQTSYYVHDLGYYNCVPGGGGVVTENMCIAEDNQGTTMTPVSCAQFFLCNHCGCTATACTGGSERNISFDVTFDGATGSGSAILPEGEHTLHLTATK